MDISSRHSSIIGKRRLSIIRSLGPLVLFTLPWSAQASLGGNSASIDADRTAMHGTATAAANSQILSTATTSTAGASANAAANNASGNGYTISSLTTAQGITIREYLSSDGKVFAVAWSGPVMPDLQQLFGDYFATFKEAASNAVATSRGRGPLSVQTGELVVHSGGMMRALHGIAYLKDSLPSGFSVDLIQ